MNTLIKIFMAVFMGISSLTIAQIPKLSTSQPMEDYKGVSRSIDEYITTIDGEHFFSAFILKFKSHYHIKRFDAKFNETLDHEIKVDKEGVIVKNTFGMDKSLYLLTLHDDRKEGKHTYHIAAFDKDITMTGGVTIADFSISSRKYEPTSHLKFSKDSSLITLVSYPNDINTKNVDFDIYVNTVDRKLNKTDSYHRKLPYNQSEFDYLDSWIDASGEAFVFGRLKQPKQEYKYVVVPIKDKQAKPITIDMGDIHALSFKMGSTGGPNFIVGGFTAEEYREISTGYFLVEIDPAQKKIVKRIAQKFSPSDLDLFKTGKMLREKGKLKGLNARFPASTLLYSCLNDQYLLNIESDYYRDKNDSRYYYTHGTFNLVLDIDLKVTDKFIIPRDLGIFGSHVRTYSLCDEKGIYFLFNDHSDNLKIYDPKKTNNMNSVSKSTPVVYHYDPNKKSKKYPITDLNYKLMINTIKKVDGHNVGFVLRDNFIIGNGGMIIGFMDLD